MRAALLDAFVYLDAPNGQRAEEEAEEETARINQLAKQANRPGQTQFSKKLRQNYRGRCAITGCNTSAALQAAHIRIQQGVDYNSPKNGMLLRADIHALFDALLITLSADGMTVEVSNTLTDQSYAYLKTVKIIQPDQHPPSPKNIQEHRKRFFAKEQERG